MRRLRDENTALRQQLKAMERGLAARGGDDGDGGDQRGGASSQELKELSRELKLVRKERDLLLARVEAAEAELERERGLHRRELRRKAKETQEVRCVVLGSRVP